MRGLMYEGKEYTDINLEAQKYLASANVYTFRYYPQDKVWMASDTMTEHFKISKFYKIEKPGDGPNIAYFADREKDLALYRRVLSGEKEVSDRIRSLNGEKYYHVILTIIEKDKEGRPVTVGGIIEEYDERTRQMEYIHMLAEDYYCIFFVDLLQDSVTAFRMSDYFNQKYRAYIEKENGYKKLMEAYIRLEVVEEERPEMQRVTSYRNLAKKFKKKKTYTHDFQILRNKKSSYIRMKIVNMSEGEKLDKIVIGFADVTVSKQEETERFAFLDEVTMGKNYNFFKQKLKKIPVTGYMVCMDVRSFKMVNVVRGMSVGDVVLREIYKIVERSVRRKGFLGHVNADHYIFFLGMETEAEVVNVINQITDKFPEMVKKFDIPSISPYFGVTGWQPGDRVHVRYSQANTAMQRKRDDKEVNYGFYSEEDNQAIIEEQLIEDSFQKALDDEMFEIWYQPKYSPGIKDLTGAEALVRWRKSDGGLISPGIFIPIFEKSGAIRELDQYVFAHVCRQQKKWQEKYGQIVPVSVNLSRASLYYNGIVEIYKGIVEAAGISPYMMPIEITESAAILNSEIKSLADEFYEAGFPMHIDDFGTGYSSLATLNLMKFDTLKLDKSLVDFIGEYGGNCLIKHTVALAKDLKIHVTAEGVEHEAQVEFLQNLECDNIQGFVYSRPLPAAEFEKLLEAENKKKM